MNLQFPFALDLTTNTVEIDTTLNKAEDITGPLYNNAYSPIWTKDKEFEGELAIDKDGNEYSIKEGVLYKNENTLFNISTTGFKRETREYSNELFDIKDNKTAEAIWDSSNHLFSITYDNNTYESPILFSEGTIVHSRIRLVTIDNITLPILVSLFIDDSGTYKILIQRGNINKVVDFQFYRRVYNISNNKPVNGFTQDETKAIYNPLIHISDEVAGNVSLISVTSNQGQPMLTSDFSYTLRAVDNETVYEDIQYDTVSVPVETTVTEEVGIAVVVNQEANTYTNVPCYGYVESTAYDNNSWMSVDHWYASMDSSLLPIEFDTGYIPNLSSNVPVDSIDTGRTDEEGTPIYRYWFLFSYEYTDNTYSYTPFIRDNTQEPNLNNVQFILDLTNTNIVNPSTTAVTLTSEHLATVIWHYTNNSGAIVSGNGLTQPTVRISYRDDDFELLTRFIFLNMTTPSDYETFISSYKITANATSAMHPNVCDDFGNLHTLGSAANTTTQFLVAGFIIPFKAQVTNATARGTSLTLTYTATAAMTLQTSHSWYAGCSIALGLNWFREVISFSSAVRSSWTNASTMLDVLYDSNHGVLYEPGVLQNNDQYYESINYFPMPYHNTGSVTYLKDDFRLLYLNNLCIGMSYGKENEIGTLVTEWNSIDYSFYPIIDDGHLIYKSTDGEWYEVWTEETNELTLLENRYLIVNTTSYFNCYDLYKEKKRHYASDYANRVYCGSPTYTTSLPQTFYSNGTLASEATLYTSGVNCNYLVTNDGLSSVAIGPNAYLRLVKGYETFNSCVQETDTDINPIDLYYSAASGSTYARYSNSFKVYKITQVRYTNPDLIGINYPVATGAYTLYSPNIFTEYLTTFNNKDSVLNGRYAYQLIYANNVTPILLFSTATQMENVSSVFVIQSQFYAVIDDKLYALVYSNGSLVEQDAIIDTTGLQFLGNLPTIAYFYSKMNKAFYSFTGDANLTLLYEANKINEVYKTYHNTSTQALYIAADSGLYVITAMAMFRLDYYNIETIFFTNKGISIVKSGNELHYISYYQRDGFEPKRLRLETKLFGPGDKKQFTIQRYKITILNNGYKPGKDVVKVSSWTLTDIGKTMLKDEVKEIKLTDWDEVTNSYQFDFVPSLQNGQGIGLTIDTPWPIAKIVLCTEAENKRETVTRRSV